MLGKNAALVVAALSTGLLMPTPASAAPAITAVDLNLRVGPGTNYGVIDVIPQGEIVDVAGCLDDYSWCDVDWDGLRGWVAARYLLHPDTTAYLPQWGPSFGLPIISFSFNIYHDRHYRDRPWYRERRWPGTWRDRRSDTQRDRREEPPEVEEPDREQDEEPQPPQQTEQPRERETERRRERETEQPQRPTEQRPQRQIEQRQQQRIEEPQRRPRSERSGETRTQQRQQPRPEAETPGRGGQQQQEQRRRRREQ